MRLHIALDTWNCLSRKGGVGTKPCVRAEARERGACRERLRREPPGGGRRTRVRRDGKDAQENSRRAPRGQHGRAPTGPEDGPEVVTEEGCVARWPSPEELSWESPEGRAQLRLNFGGALLSRGAHGGRWGHFVP